MNSINIGIVDDEALFRRGMRLILGDYSDFNTIMEAENGKDLLEKLATADPLPDILMLDLQMPEMDGIEATKIIHGQYPKVHIIILTTHYSKSFIINMIELGAASYLAKNSDPEKVANTIREVHRKGFSYDSQVMTIIRENMVSGYANHPVSFGPVKLTKRELEILQLICDQCTTSEIAEKLFISPRTVDGHRNNLLEKTGSKNTAGLVVYAIQKKIVDLDSQKKW